MTAAAIICVLLVLAAAVRYAGRNRSITEQAVDLLYTAAAIMYSAAQAADAALVRYRRARQEIRERHEPMYAEVMR